MYRLEVEDWFSSAHQLREYQGKCENLHGHNWKVRMQLEGKELNDLGMLVDFTDAKKVLKELMDFLDHKFLNDLPPFDKINPTSELIAKFIAEEADKKMPQNARVSAVTIWESEKCSATYLQ